MNSKEAKKILSDICKAYRNFSTEEIRALELAIKALEQQDKVEKLLKVGVLKDCESCRAQKPCTDAISRQAVIDALSKTSGIRGDALKALYELPSVSTEKTGRWIFVDKAKEHAHCSECDYGNVDLFDGRPHNYCPNCGARMEVEE